MRKSPTSLIAEQERMRRRQEVQSSWARILRLLRRVATELQRCRTVKVTFLHEVSADCVTVSTDISPSGYATFYYTDAGRLTGPLVLVPQQGVEVRRLCPSFRLRARANSTYWIDEAGDKELTWRQMENYLRRLLGELIPDRRISIDSAANMRVRRSTGDNIR